jgi:hypothetical protein
MVLMHREYPSTLTLTHKHILPPLHSPSPLSTSISCAGIFKQSMGARNRVGIGLWERLQRMAELIPWDRFLGSLKVKKFEL